MLFNKMASTTAGNYLVTSTNGELRMYTKMGQNAKTLLPGIGQEIIGVDTSHNGHWILATCPNVIMVIPTQCSNGKTGFEKRMGAEKPAPRTLRLSNNDVVRFNLRGKSFTRATFDNGKTNHDKYVVTSIGSFIVSWKLSHIKRGELGNYRIKNETEEVVCSEYRFDAQDVLITMPQKMALGKRK